MGESEPNPSSSSTDDDPWVGRVVAGKFRLGGLLGEGGMGKVYRGEQLSLGKGVAIKVLHKHLGGDARIARRFHREARAASRLSHPNSLQVIDFGEADDGTLFIAMELLEGDSLQAVIDTDSPLTPRRIADLMIQMLRALEEAHHAGIIHRDLKPENVIVVEDRHGRERVKVCDFGMAKIMESEGRTTAITKDGYVCGTPQYMPPEQARGEALDARADVYAAGVVLYQMLCGVVPFTAETALGIITKHLTEEPTPPRARRPALGIPASLDRIAMKAIRKDPDARYSTAAELAQAIEDAVRELGDRALEPLGAASHLSAAATEPADHDNVISGEATVERPAAVPAQSGHAWLYALALALAVLAFGIWLWARPAPPPPTPEDARSTPAAGDPSPDTRRPPSTPHERAEPREHVRSPEPAALETRGRREPAAPTLSERPLSERPPPPEPAPPAASASPRPAPGTRPSRRDGRPETALTASPTSSPGQDALDEGGRLMTQGDLQGAISRLNEAARLMPRSGQAQRQLGRAYMRHGDLADSVASYRRYLALSPDAPDRAIVERIIAQHAE